MADWSDIQFNAGQTDYITRLNSLLSRAQTFATEVENGRLGSPSLQTQISTRLNQAEVDARIVALAPTYVAGLTQNFNANARRIFALADPVNPQDAATRAWVLSVVTAGGDPSGIPVTSFNVGTMADTQVLTRSGTGLVGRTIAAGSARVTVAFSAGAITIDVPAGAFATLGAANTFSAIQTFSERVNLQSASPALFFLETDAAADGRLWRLQANGGSLELAVGNDAESTFTPVFSVARSGTTVTGITFATNVSDQFGNVRDISLRTSNANTNILASDRGGEVNKTDNSTPTFTIRTDANGNYGNGFSTIVANDGSTGNVTIGLEAGVTLTAGTTTGPFALPPGQSRLLRRVGANTWRLR